MTMEAVYYTQSQSADPFTAENGDINKNLGKFLDRVWAPLTVLVVWSLFAAGICVFATIGIASYFLCCKKKDGVGAIQNHDQVDD